MPGLFCSAGGPGAARRCWACCAAAAGASTGRRGSWVPSSTPFPCASRSPPMRGAGLAAGDRRGERGPAPPRARRPGRRGAVERAPRRHPALRHPLQLPDAVVRARLQRAGRRLGGARLPRAAPSRLPADAHRLRHGRRCARRSSTTPTASTRRRWRPCSASSPPWSRRWRRRRTRPCRGFPSSPRKSARRWSPVAARRGAFPWRSASTSASRGARPSGRKRRRSRSAGGR